MSLSWSQTGSVPARRVDLDGIAMLFVFAYVDIFALLRADVLNAALDGKMATTGFTINQSFLTLTLI
jgi:hypothetical protein